MVGERKNTNMARNKKLFICLIVMVLLALALAFIVLIAFGENPTLKQQSDFAININSRIASEEAFSNGFIFLLITSPSGIIIEGNVHMYLDGVEKATYKTIPESLDIPTFGLDNGRHTLSLVALSQDSGSGYGEITVLIEDPEMVVVSLEYPEEVYPGMLFMIAAEISGPASYMVANYSSLFGYSEIFTSKDKEGQVLTDTLSIPKDFVSEERFYSISLIVYSTEGRTLIVPGIEIFFQSGATNPFTIDEGIVDMRSFPLTAPSDSALTLTLPPSFEVSLTTGQSVEIPIILSQSAAVSEVLVGFEGYGQHFIVPIRSLQNQNSRRSTRQTNSGDQDQTNTNHTSGIILTLPIGSIVNGSGLDTLIRLRDNVGNLGLIETIPTTMAKLELGTLHVRLTWDKEVDLDLHVVDPYTEEIYYGNRDSTEQRGFLDLDSNPNCRIDHIRTENIYYDHAVSGKYVVRVSLFASCNVKEQINFQVFVDRCKISQTLNGTFQPSEAHRGGRGSGREILVFFVDCDNYLVGGTISYRTHTTRKNPLGSIVRVVDSQGIILGTSQVVFDEDDSRGGAYSVVYEPTDGSTPVYVEFLSSNNKIEVTDHAGIIHVYRVKESITPNLETNALRNSIIREEDSSGAFNIMVTLTRMLPLYLAYGGEVTDYPRRADWEYGKYANDTDYPASYFEHGTVSVGGNPLDPDEFDDSLLLRAFGFLIMDRTGAKITGGESHHYYRTSPNFAFFEGYPMYLGQKVLGNLIYCDGTCTDLSKILELDYLGTVPSDVSSGIISEDVVASAAFKLDFNLGLGTLMAQSLTDPNKLLKKSNYDRLGSTSDVDFADMVSIVVCPLNAEQKKKSSNLLKLYNLPWISEVGFCV